jgi:hypothetical protein
MIEKQVMNFFHLQNLLLLLLLVVDCWQQVVTQLAVVLVQPLLARVDFVPVEVVAVILEPAVRLVAEVIQEGEEHLVQLQLFQKEGEVMLFLKEMLQSWVLILLMHLNIQNKLGCIMDYLHMGLQNILS